MKHVKCLVRKSDSKKETVIEATFSNDQWATLKNFCRYTDELFEESRLAREGGAGNLKLSWTQEEGAHYQVSLPDSGDVSTLLHRLRPLILQDEATSVKNIRSVLGHRLEHEGVRNQLGWIGKIFEGRRLQSLFQIHASGPSHDRFYQINSEKTLNAWLYGFEYHRNVKHREHIESLHGGMPLEVSKVFFLHMIQEKVEAIRFLRGVVAVLGGESKEAIVPLPPPPRISHQLYLLPHIEFIQDISEMSAENRAMLAKVNDTPTFAPAHFEGGNTFTGAMHYLWNRWLEGSIPAKLGTLPVFLLVPDGFVSGFGDGPAKNGLLNLVFKMQVVVVTVEGEVRTKPIKDRTTGEVSLDLDPSGMRSTTVTVVDTPEVFEKFLRDAETKGEDLGQLLKVPRFPFRRCYWPPTMKAQQRIKELKETGEEATFEAIEGPDLGRAWEIFSEIGIDLEQHGINLWVDRESILEEQDAGEVNTSST